MEVPHGYISHGEDQSGLHVIFGILSEEKFSFSRYANTGFSRCGTPKEMPADSPFDHSWVTLLLFPCLLLGFISAC